MRSRPVAVAATIAIVFLLATNPVVVNAAGELTGQDIKNTGAWIERKAGDKK